MAKCSGSPLRGAPGRDADDAEYDGDGQHRFLPETCLTPFTTQRQRRDEKDENDAHSTEIKIARSNEIQAHQTHG